MFVPHLNTTTLTQHTLTCTHNALHSLRTQTKDSRVLPAEAYGGKWNPIGKGAPPDGAF